MTGLLIFHKAGLFTKKSPSKNDGDFSMSQIQDYIYVNPRFYASNPSVLSPPQLIYQKQFPLTQNIS